PAGPAESDGCRSDVAGACGRQEEAERSTHRPSPCQARSGKSSAETASLVGTSKDKVEKIRSIEKYAEETDDHGNQHTGGKPVARAASQAFGKSSVETAARLGIGQASVERHLAVESQPEGVRHRRGHGSAPSRGEEWARQRRKKWARMPTFPG